MTARFVCGYCDTRLETEGGDVHELERRHAEVCPERQPTIVHVPRDLLGPLGLGHPAMAFEPPPSARGRAMREAFLRRIEERLDQGSREYGDESYRADPSRLVRELEEEAVDAAAWASILQWRLSNDGDGRPDLAAVVTAAASLWDHIKRLRSAGLPSGELDVVPFGPPTEWLRSVLMPAARPQNGPDEAENAGVPPESVEADR